MVQTATAAASQVDKLLLCCSCQSSQDHDFMVQASSIVGAPKVAAMTEENDAVMRTADRLQRIQYDTAL